LLMKMLKILLLLGLILIKPSSLVISILLGKIHYSHDIYAILNDYLEVLSIVTY
jgi:hypothetical protein